MNNKEAHGDASYSDKEGSDSGDKKKSKTRNKDAKSGPQRYISNACVNCRALHRRCNGQTICSNCKKRGIECVYGEPTKRGPKSRKGQADGDENYRDQNSKRSKHSKRSPTNDMYAYGAMPLNINNPFLFNNSKQEAELPAYHDGADARTQTEHGVFHRAIAHIGSEQPLLKEVWSDLVVTWGTVVRDSELQLPPPPHPSLPATSTLDLLSHEPQLLGPHYSPAQLAVHAYRGVLLAFGMYISLYMGVYP